MSRRRVTAEEVYSMEDSDYRDLMRKDLLLARKNYGRQSSQAITILVSVLLIFAAGAVVLHHMGLIELPQ